MHHKSHIKVFEYFSILDSKIRVAAWRIKFLCIFVDIRAGIPAQDGGCYLALVRFDDVSSQLSGQLSAPQQTLRSKCKIALSLGD
jgi:hypothetical protein